MDPLVALAGHDRARRLEEADPMLAWSLRLAAREVIIADMRRTAEEG